MFCSDNFYNLVFSSTNPIFEKIFIPDIWAKIFSANQIAGFFNQPYLQNKSMMDFRGIQFDYICFQSKSETGQISKSTKSLRAEAVVNKLFVKKSVFEISTKF